MLKYVSENLENVFLNISSKILSSCTWDRENFLRAKNLTMLSKYGQWSKLKWYLRDILSRDFRDSVWFIMTDYNWWYIECV